MAPPDERHLAEVRQMDSRNVVPVVRSAADMTALVVELRPVLVTSVVDGLDHAVSDENMAAGIEAGRGQYRAVCGAVVVPDALSVPPRRLCSGCNALMYPLVASTSECRVIRQRGHRRPGPVRRWVASLTTLRRAARAPGWQR
jgi:hypothetical protein